jgi:hypothetical protein
MRSDLMTKGPTLNLNSWLAQLMNNLEMWAAKG